MQEFLYGKLNSETIIKQYTSVESPTLKLYIDNKQNTISGQVLVAPKTLGSLRIKMAGELVGESFNGSKDVEINIPPLVLDKSDTETADIDLSDDNTHLRVNVKRVPSKLIINKSNEKIEYDGSSEVEITLSDDVLARVDELDSNLNVISDNVAVNTVDIEGVKNNTTLIKKENGGFFAGDVSSTSLSSTQPDLIAIGTGANASGSRSIAIGKNAKATGTQTNNRGVAIGTNATTGPGVAIGPSTQSEGGVAIGIYPKAKSRNSVAIGTNANVYDYSDNGTAIGEFAYAGAANASSSNTSAYCIAIGSNSEANKTKAIAIGSGAFPDGGATAKAVEAIQLGSGTNSSQKTLQIWEHQLLDGNTGKIPDERLSDNILKVTSQTLTIEQQAQVKENLGIANSDSDLTYISKFTNKLIINLSNAPSLNGSVNLPIVESSNFLIDWGDGYIEKYDNPIQVLTHTYSNTNFIGKIYIYGTWNGIQFSNVEDDNQLIIEDFDYDMNITSINDYAFYSCKNLKCIKISEYVDTLGKDAFYHCFNVVDIYYNAELTSYTKYAFESSARKGVVLHIGQNVKTLPESIFGGMYSWMAVTAIEGGYNLQELGRYSICVQDTPSVYDKNVKVMTDITFHESLCKLSHYAFYDYRNISKITFKSKTPPVFDSSPIIDGAVKTLIVPTASLKQYKTATNWTKYANKIYPDSDNYSETITIPASSWDSATNTVTVEAVGSTSETRNIIEWFTSRDNAQVENTYGLNCTEQGTMSLTFTCETIPSEDIQVSVRYTLTNY